MGAAPGSGGPIFLLARSLNIGGAERQLVHLAAGLHARGEEVVVGLFYTGGVLDAELEARGIRIVDLRKSGRWDVPAFLKRVRGAIAEVRPSVVYSFLGTANIVAAAVRPFAPRFRMVWSIRASDMDPASYDWVFRLNYGLECALSRSADLIISNSHAGRDYAAGHGFPRERIAVVPNGIDTDRFRPDPALRAAKRAEWGLGEGETAIGVLARIDPMKDHPVFLRAAALAARARPELRFLCIGEGDPGYLAELKRLAGELGLEDRLLWTGRSTDPVAALNGLDISCSSSAFGEGFSNAVGEAMACALPCVVTDVGDSARLVGDTGRVVPPRDPEALAAALLAEADAPGGGNGARARQRIVQCFSLDAMVERTLALLRPPA
ncbi:MAG: glycosyltransferase [Allosphingosinicella sp.]